MEGGRTYSASWSSAGREIGDVSMFLFGGFGLGEAGTASETSVGRLADLW